MTDRFDITFVIPAQAGIQAAHPPSGNNQGPLDSLSFPRRRELRRNDEGKVVPQAHADSSHNVGAAHPLSPKGELSLYHISPQKFVITS
jgi:hypothetical protein